MGLMRWEGSPDVRARIAALLACVAMVLACSVLTVKPTERSLEDGVKVRIESAEGGTLALTDGARLVIPAGSLPADTEVWLRRVEAGSATGGKVEFTNPVGALYEVDLGGQDLAGPVTLEIPFDPKALPAGVEVSEVFLTYLDEALGEWVFAGGEVDPARNMIVLEVVHASLWEPATWNWEAWAAALNGILSANIVSIVEGVAVLVDDCPQDGQYVSVDASGANGLIQGCVERDDAQAPELRIVNPRGIYVEVQPMADWVYFKPTLLAPGESLRFQGDTGKPSPYVVSADVTQRAGWRLVIHMTIAMLPGFNQLRFQGQTIACLTEALADVSYLASAADAIVDGNGAAAFEHLVDMYKEEDVMRRLKTGAADCDYGPAATWSIPGLKIVGASLATIQSSAELSYYYLSNTHGEVEFLVPTFTPPGRIIYAIAVPDSDPIRYQILLSNGIGTDGQVLVDDSYYSSVDLSPDGTKLVYAKTVEKGWPFELWVLDRVSGKSQLLVPQERTGSGMYPDTPYSYGGVRWSPNGASVYYIRGCFCTDVDSLWKVDVENPANRERLTDLGDRVAGFTGYFDISPTTGKLLVVSINPAGGSYDVFLADDRMRGREPISTSASPRGCPGTFSPDGKSFAFSAWVGDFGNIFVKFLDGSAETQLTHGNYMDSCPSWSPDGKWLVFPRFTSIPGNADLWAVSVADGKLIQITNTPDISEEMPVWGP